MRISYWSSDVCSSDLFVLDCGPAGDGAAHRKALDLRRQPLRRRGETGGHDEHLRTRIAQDIVGLVLRQPRRNARSEEHTSELQSLMRNSYAVFCLKKKKIIT